MPKSIADWVPELLPYCHSAYANPSVLYYGQYSIMSQEGPQQGDPLGPLLFCNTIHPQLESLGSVLRLGYMDDVTLNWRLSGDSRKGRPDSDGCCHVGRDLGLNINVSKCELIAQPGCHATVVVVTFFTDPTLRRPFNRSPRRTQNFWVPLYFLA